MRTLAKKVAAACAMTAAMTTGLAGLGTSAHAADGCIGFPESGGIYYHCLTVNPILPTVSLSGTTPVGTTVPAFCYFLGCTETTPVGTTVPVAVSTSRPSSDVTVFELGISCYEWAGYCDTYYRLWYDAPSTNCEFETNDPNLSALNGQRVRCVV